MNQLLVVEFGPEELKQVQEPKQILVQGSSIWDVQEGLSFASTVSSYEDGNTDQHGVWANGRFISESSDALVCDIQALSTSVPKQYPPPRYWPSHSHVLSFRTGCARILHGKEGSQRHLKPNGQPRHISFLCQLALIHFMEQTPGVKCANSIPSHIRPICFGFPLYAHEVLGNR